MTDRTPLVARAVELAGWVAVAVMGLLALTQVTGATPFPAVYMGQALTPYLLAPAVPIAVLALLAGRHLLALVSGGVAAALVVLAAPVFLHAAPEVPEGAPSFTVTHANTYFRNTDPAAAAAAVLAQDADLIAITEQSPGTQEALRAMGVDDLYGWSTGTSSNERNGVGLYSRFRILEQRVGPIGSEVGIDAVIEVEGSPVRVLVVHPLPGIDRDGLDALHGDLRAIADTAAADTVPTLIVGDFNASRWHPAFRDLLRDHTDAHEALGAGFSASWPHGRSVPPFVRLDRALTDDGLAPQSIDDFVVPGSDHRGFTVRLALRGVSG